MAVFYERGGIMQELENILKEIDTHAIEFELFGTSDDYISVGWVKDIIRKHISGKDINVTTNNGWIPVEERLPEAGEHVLVSFKSAGFLPATAIISENGRWSMLQGAKGFNDVTEDVIAWRPLPEPYQAERSDNNDGE